MWLNHTNIMLKKRCKIQKNIVLYIGKIKVFRNANIGSKTEKKKRAGGKKQGNDPKIQDRSGQWLPLAKRVCTGKGPTGPRASGCCKALFLRLGIGITWAVSLLLFVKLHIHVLCQFQDEYHFTNIKQANSNKK